MEELQHKPANLSERTTDIEGLSELIAALPMVVRAANAIAGMAKASDDEDERW